MPACPVEELKAGQTAEPFLETQPRELDEPGAIGGMLRGWIDHTVF
jgi:hypothetical protein